MALSPEIRASQLDVSTIIESGDGLLASQLDASVIFNIPSLQIDASQLDMVTVRMLTSAMEVSMLDVIAIFKGRVDDPSVRCWTFTLDGHDFYVLRLGNQETLVYDMLVGEWYLWGSGLESDLWRAYSGINWRGANRWGPTLGSDVVVGDDGNGSLYLLNPEADTDDDALEGFSLQRPFTRQVLAQAVLTGGYDYVSCFSAQMFGSVGQLVQAGDITLEVSDDRGESYWSAGSVEVQPGTFELRVEWQSLGSMRAPGRLFKFTDYGAVHRIDNLELDREGGDVQV